MRLDQVVDKNFAYWHSATFNNDGTKVIFTDEWGGGTRPRCRANDLPNWGADAIFDIVDRKLQLRRLLQDAGGADRDGELRRPQRLADSGARAATSWCRRGIRAALSVFDFTDSAKPVEIAFFDRGPIDAKQLITGGYWSTYWYNGHIYGSEIARGIDVFKLTPSEHPVAERDRRGDDGPDRGAQHAGADAGRLAGERDGGARVSRSADAQQGHQAGAAREREDGARQARTACAPARSAARPRRSISSTRWRRSSKATPARPPGAMRCGSRRSPRRSRGARRYCGSSW